MPNRAQPLVRCPIEVELLDLSASCSPRDTATATQAMRTHGCGAVVVLGGDGTNRQVAKTWPDAPLVPMSTGTNNVFPSMVEATTAGAAAGLVASGRIPLDCVSRRAKVVVVGCVPPNVPSEGGGDDVEVGDGTEVDVAGGSVDDVGAVGSDPSEQADAMSNVVMMRYRTLRGNRRPST